MVALRNTNVVYVTQIKRKEGQYAKNICGGIYKEKYFPMALCKRYLTTEKEVTNNHT